MLYDRIEVAGIKLAVRGMESLDISAKSILIKSVIWLKDCYEHEPDKCFLQKALWNIYAYLELGFPYESGQPEFSAILKYLQLDKNELFQDGKYFCSFVTLNKANVCNLLGKWNPTLHSMKIADVVDDIMKKVEGKELGKYEYHSGKVLVQDGEKTLWENTFRLCILPEEAMLCDINKNKYYMFK